MIKPQRDNTPSGTIPYEQLLAADFDWALREGSMHFERDSSVHKTLMKIAAKLDAPGISYAVAGGIAAFYHGYRRFTEHVDILITKKGLDRAHKELEGLGYLPPFAGSKQLRDVETGVRIDFLVTGTYPGDGKPKAVAFPDPSDAAVEIGGIKFINVNTLVTLKIISGSVPGRLKDWGDVQELIRTLPLPRDLADQLDASVRDKFVELWDQVQQTPEQP
jgi:hypothetical protein